jgi:hypothetical protein
MTMSSTMRLRAWVTVGLLASACGGGGGGGGGTPSGGWAATTVKPGSSIRSISIALDSVGAPHVAFIDHVTYQVFYGSLVGGAWSVALVPGSVNADEEISLVLDAQDRPRLAYQCDTAGVAGGIRYAWSDGAAWHVETVELTGVGARNPSLSLALTSAGAPAISFYGGDNFGMKYATRSGAGTWSIAQSNPARYAGFHGTSLVFDAADRPVVSFFDYDLQKLQLARLVGATWSYETVDATAGAGEWSTLALDAAGRPHLAYLAVDGTVKYATKAAAWTIETVGTGYLTSLALAPDGTPWVAYGVSAASWVKVTHRVAGAWSAAETLPATSADWTMDLVVDRAGVPHLAYDAPAASYATRR